MAVAVSPLETVAGHGVLWAAPSRARFYRSEDGGATWAEMTGLQNLPSKPTWSFPPRPWTHHVRWIEPDPTEPARLFAGIELGGVMRSVDGGTTWEDRKPNSQHDCHTLRTHPAASGVLYEAEAAALPQAVTAESPGSAATTACFTTTSGGWPWTRPIPTCSWCRRHPDHVAHNDAYAEARLHRRSSAGPWQPLAQGLPPAKGTRAFVLATHPGAPHTFYAATRRDLYRSTDGGVTWAQLPVAWPADVTFTTVNALALADVA
ncbi:MAG: hypothetical protein R3A10_19510 [Caldilineaceae bacterium]